MRTIAKQCVSAHFLGFGVGGRRAWGRRVVPRTRPRLPAPKPCTQRGHAGEGRSGGAEGDNRLPEAAVPEAGAGGRGDVGGGENACGKNAKKTAPTELNDTIFMK